MRYSLQSLVDEYTRSSHKPPAAARATATCYTPSYTPSVYTPKYYAPSYTPSYTPSSAYTPSAYTPTHYAAVQSASALYTPRRAEGAAPKQAAAAPKEPAAKCPAESAGSAPGRRPPLKPARSVHFPNNIIFQDLIRHGELVQMGKFLRSQNVRLNKPFPSGMVALHEAVLTGNLECVKLLVKNGADIHMRDDDGWTALHMACSDGYPEIARYLLTRGASTVAENESGERPADLIDPECKELVEMFAVGCV